MSEVNKMAEQITLEALIQHYGNHPASDIGQETVDRLEELQRARKHIADYERQVVEMRAAHRQEIREMQQELRESVQESYSNGRWDEREDNAPF